MYGDCGSSNISLRNISGYSTIDWGFDSTVGDADYRALFVDYSGGSATGSINDFSTMFNYIYEKGEAVDTGFGANAVLGGTIEIWWGLTCYMAGPAAHG